jgi:hypothetical protein
VFAAAGLATGSDEKRERFSGAQCRTFAYARVPSSRATRMSARLPDSRSRSRVAGDTGRLRQSCSRPPTFLSSTEAITGERATKKASQGARRVSLPALRRCGRIRRVTPAPRICVSPGLSGKCLWRVPWFHEKRATPGRRSRRRPGRRRRRLRCWRGAGLHLAGPPGPALGVASDSGLPLLAAVPARLALGAGNRCQHGARANFSCPPMAAAGRYLAATVYRGAASAELKLTRLPRRSCSRESGGDPVESASQHRCAPGWIHTCLLPRHGGESRMRVGGGYRSVAVDSPG